MESSESTALVTEEKISFWAKLKQPQYSHHRYIVLFLLCLINIGNYSVYDCPAALSEKIQSQISGVTVRNYPWLYALYSYPNVILSLIGGYLIDRVFGIRLGSLVFVSLVLAGQVVLTLGAFTNSFFLMGLGRFIFGLGGENLSVVQNSYCVSWFKGAELNMAFGLTISFSRIGNAMNFQILPLIYHFAVNTLKVEGNIAIAIGFTFGVFMCLVSLFSAITVAVLDKRAKRILKADDAITGDVIKIKDILHLSGSFWLLNVICVFFYSAVLPFISLGKLFFLRKYSLDTTTANLINSLIYYVSAVVSPVFGWLIDKIGYNMIWVVSSAVITLTCHTMLAFTYITPAFVVTLMGISFSILACSFWPLVSFIVPEHQLSTAYGIVQSIQNLGFAITDQLSGIITDSKGYIMFELFFLICLNLALAAIFSLYLNDIRLDLGLNYSTKKRKMIADEKKAREDAERKRREIMGTSPETVASASLLVASDDQIRNRYLSKVVKKNSSKSKTQIP